MIRALSRFVPLALLAALLAAPLGNDAAAQTAVQIGPRLGFDAADIESAYVGFDSRFISSLPVVINPTLDIYFPDDGSFFNVKVNALYYFPVQDPTFSPYVGGGLGIYSGSIDLPNRNDIDDTSVGLNFLGGLSFRAGDLRPYVELHVSPTFNDLERYDTLFGIGGGLLFNI